MAQVLSDKLTHQMHAVRCDVPRTRLLRVLYDSIRMRRPSHAKETIRRRLPPLRFRLSRETIVFVADTAVASRCRGQAIAL